MHDWEGSRAREDALTVPCRYCRAAVGQPCVTRDGRELQAFPAHAVRISDAAKGAANA